MYHYYYYCIRNGCLVLFVDGVSIEDSSGTHHQHAQLRTIHGHNGPGDFEEENRQSGKRCFGSCQLLKLGDGKRRRIRPFCTTVLVYVMMLKSKQTECKSN